MPYTLEDYRRAADCILGASDRRPRVAVVLGSGLGGFARRVQAPVRVPYAEIPGFPASTAPSHAGELLLGEIGGVEVCVLSGRFHYYEGWSFEQSAFYVGALHLAGVDRLILTNAAGCINPGFKPGDLMLVRDHLNLSGYGPARGANIEGLGPRFFDMTDAYSKELREKALACAAQLSLDVRQGVYAYMPGPQYETPAEIRALGLLGADAVGMSTVPEAIMAAHCGVKTLCVSCLTNYAAGITGQPLTGEEVTQTARLASEKLENYISQIIISII